MRIDEIEYAKLTAKIEHLEAENAALKVSQLQDLIRQALQKQDALSWPWPMDEASLLDVATRAIAKAGELAIENADLKAQVLALEKMRHKQETALEKIAEHRDAGRGDGEPEPYPAILDTEPDAEAAVWAQWRIARAAFGGGGKRIEEKPCLHHLMDWQSF